MKLKWYNFSILGFLVFYLLFSCNTKNSNSLDSNFANDPCSFSQPNLARITHLNLNLSVDFDNKILKGFAEYDIISNKSQEIIFDTNDSLTIDSIYADGNKISNYSWGEKNPHLGRALKVEIKPTSKKVKLYYKTNPNASALQWIPAHQTTNKKYPFLFTQGQFILTRSFIPIQDTPSIRITYNATIKVPKGLLALMSAKNPKQIIEDGIYSFKMKQPIPPYLMALAIGDLEYKSLNKISGVYADPITIQAAHEEFSNTPKMITTANQLYGKYPWEQYDLLVLPPSFPYGGMENPRLTFITPTVITGDKSLTNLIAHELAHSWSGNLVTNATWDDFWINEGFTVYLERQIMKEVEGEEYVKMIESLGYENLEEAINNLGPENPYTALKINLNGANPEDAYSAVPYEKGYFFLNYLENRYGKENFTTFLKSYFEKFKFKTITTEQFIQELKESLTQGQDDFVETWVYNPGMPPLKKPISERLVNVENYFNEWLNGKITATKIPNSNWSTYEYLQFIRLIPEEGISESQMTDLDNKFDFTHSKNTEIAALWYEKAVYNSYKPAYASIEQFLRRVGKKRNIIPIFRAFIDNGNKELGAKLYKQVRPNYHPVTYKAIDKLFSE